ncbi:MAG TPA: DNA polymerase IV [Chthoniobacterales bacterium]
MDRPERKIIHLDMDAFYASIEIRDHPELAGKPVGVGGARNERGVLTTCNYEARKYGVRSAMPTFMALQKCPELILLPTRFDVYRRDSGIIRSILDRYTPLVEPLSLDEAYLDVTAHEGDPAALAYVIRQQIFQKTKLTASAGIAPNKLLAKIASDWRKPNGQFQIKPEEIADFIATVPVTRLWGVGRVGAAKLEKLKIVTCADLQRLSRIDLIGHFGKFGLDLYQQCRGIDDRPVETDRERRSLSNERTFSLDLLTMEQCLDRLPELHAELTADLAKQTHTPPLAGIFLKLKFNDFSKTSVDRAGLTPTLANYRLLLEEAFARTGKPVRLIGIGIRFADHALPGSPSQLEFALE